ncbi:Orn/Lys/Arg decarboxylase N-terminal domain-containing protein [Cetobacterium somerae]|uniref:Orn/Lys/Arg family decarboxylase n=1 Tax=Cetobacterium somerae TaxID=188913 RepID=UPI003D767BC2
MESINYLDWSLLVLHKLDSTYESSKKIDDLLENFNTLFVDNSTDFKRIFDSNKALSGIVLDLDEDAEEIVKFVRETNPKIPIFILTEEDSSKLSLQILKLVNIVMNVFEDSTSFLSGQLELEVEKYMSSIKPIFFGKLMDYTHKFKYPWHTPGHAGGLMFMTNPIGKMMLDFYGENTLRSDLSISVPELGSLLDDEGPVKDAESNSARVFSADKTYYILNGTSSVNQVIWKGRVTKDNLAFVDRNCHKSLNYGMVITEAIPMYMIPRRNNLGIIGPVKLEEFTKEYIDKIIQNNPKLTEEQKKQKIKMSALTNSTYDGLCYNVNKIKEALNNNVENLHFDEAWYAYAKFHPIYKNHYAMTESDNFIEHPPIFASHSTHKLLGAFSQASMLHVKDGTKDKVDFVVFDEAYLMYGSTSPQYSMIASLDVSTAMMDFCGDKLMDETILNAIHFRKRIAKLNKEYASFNEWFFSLWQPEKVLYNGTLIDFEDVPDKYLLEHQECWTLDSDNNWHGFNDIEKNYVMLDPIKLTLKCPGLNVSGKYDEIGIPATILSNYIIDRGVVNEKTDTYSLLFLHSIGTTVTKQEALIKVLMDFKKDFDNNTPLKDIFPDLVSSYPEKYSTKGLKDHCLDMHNYIKESKLLELMDKAFQVIPKQELTPAEASREVFRGNIEHLPLKDCMNRTAGVIVVPYPPGIPVLMGGERIDEASKSILNFLLAREEFERVFPGYFSDIHGIEAFNDEDGVRRFHTMVIKN